MDFLKSMSGTEVDHVLHGERLNLQIPKISDYASWVVLRTQSHDFLKKWEPRWLKTELTKASFRRRIRYYQKDIRNDTGCAFFIFRKHDEALIGGLTLTNVRRGVVQSCSLGYWIGEPFCRKGYMTEAINIVIPFVFKGLGLHRLEAACVPHNIASIRLLEKTGFQHEGLARSYLQINDVWQDHLLYAQLKDDLG